VVTGPPGWQVLVVISHTGGRSDGLAARPSRAWAVIVLCAVLSGTAALASGWPLWETHLAWAVVTVAACVAFGASGALLATAPATARPGLLLLGAGLLWASAWSGSWDGPLLPTASGYAQSTFFLVLALAVLTLAGSAPYSTVERWWLLAAVVVLWGGEAYAAAGTPSVRWGFTPGAWWPWLLASAYLTLAYSLALLSRRRARRLHGLDRTLSVPVLAVLGVSVVAAAVVQFAGMSSLDAANRSLAVQGLLALAVPLTIAGRRLSARWAELGVAGRVLRLTSSPTAPEVRGALRTVLQDPTLDVWFWAADEGQYIDAAGRTPPPPGSRPRVPVPSADGGPLALLEGDPTLAAHDGLVRAAGRAAAPALEIARLNAVLEARIHEAQAAQERLVTAEAGERRRIEQDLHDGLQQRLLAAALDLAAIRQTTTDAVAREQIEACRLTAVDLVDDVRRLVRGIHPADLSQGGLATALQAVAERLSLRLRLDDDMAAPLRPHLESNAYFALSEVLVDMAGHRPGGPLVLSLATEGNHFVGRVHDGGTSEPATDRGSAYLGARDRIRAVRGSLNVTHRPDTGTTVEVRLPCA
jgi:signal transduction histidine kinase